jgi:hypothetical protein
MCQIRKSVCIALGIVALLALANAANADLVPWTDFDHKWDMSTAPLTSGLPDQDSVPPPNGGVTLTTDGSLNVLDLYDGYSGSVSTAWGGNGGIWPGNFSDATGYTIEAKVKVLSMMSGKQAAYALHASASGSTKSASIGFADTGTIAVGGEQGGVQTYTTLDSNSNTDGYHVLRMTYSDTALLNVWRDGIQIGTGLTGMKVAVNDLFYSGQAFTGWSRGRALVDYLAITPGLAGYDPATPEPSSIVLLGTGLLGLLAYAWRKRK